MTMKLWYLAVQPDGFGYDGEVSSAIVRAENEQDARECFRDFYGEEGLDVWLDVQTSICVELPPAEGDRGSVYIETLYRD